MIEEPTLEEIQRVVKLSHAERYRYFIKRAVETALVYALAIGSDYVMLDDDSSKTICCPLWPAAIFAEMWAGPEQFASPHYWNPKSPRLSSM